jgi:hypothetical protein
MPEMWTQSNKGETGLQAKRGIEIFANGFIRRFNNPTI